MNPASPLDQLKDIHLPDAVSIWPLAWPWWAMLIALVSLIAFSVYRYNKNQWRRQALKQLNTITTQDEVICIQQCNRLLKQVALYRFGQTCASLSGEKWLEFLDAKVKKPIFCETLSEFAIAPDRPAIGQHTLDVIKLKKAIESWIRKHTC
jgi:hypothetical protein